MKNKILLLTIMSLIISINLEAQVSGSFTDSRDGKKYKTVKIGNQVWMAENLNYSKGNGRKSFCFEDEKSNCDNYGRLYSFETAQKVCPSGWHLPSKSEIETLFDNYEGDGKEAYIALKEGGSSGFNLQLGGRRNYSGYIVYFGIGVDGWFWSSTELDNDLAWGMYSLSILQKAGVATNGEKGEGRSVRCIKN